MSNSEITFESLNLLPEIRQALTDAGYNSPTPVQAKSIPEAIAGHDLMVSAPTGTGKTASFVLPALQRLAQPSTKHGRGPRVLVLTPTRELATQVTSNADKYSKHLRRLRIGTVLGGMPYPKQRKLLEQPLDILVATPGRLIDFIEQGKVDFSRLEMLVLDEADRMLDMGFIKPVETIAAATPTARQTLLFSATLDGNIAKLAQRLLKNPKLIEVAAPKAKHEHIEQRLHLVDDGSHKHRLLDHLLRKDEVKQAIVFTATKHGADRLADKLYDNGHLAAALHGNMNQSQRNRTLDKVRRGDVVVLVATDVAARGIDVANISHVINFDLPKVAEDYVHRIGRTGRGGASGVAISFASNDDRRQLQQIERYTGNRIERSVVEGFEPKFASDAPARGGGERSERRGGNGGRGGRDGNGGRRFGNNDGQRPSRRFGGEQRGNNAGFGAGERREHAPRSFSGDSIGNTVRDDNFGNREYRGNREEHGAPRGENRGAGRGENRGAGRGERSGQPRGERQPRAPRDDNWGNRAATSTRTSRGASTASRENAGFGRVTTGNGRELNDGGGRYGNGGGHRGGGYGNGGGRGRR